MQKSTFPGLRPVWILAILLFLVLMPAAILPADETPSPEARQLLAEGQSIMESASSDVSLQLALRKFEQAAELAPQWSEVHYYLGVARNAMADFRAAVQSFNRYLELAPEAADAETVRDLIRQIQPDRRRDAQLAVNPPFLRDRLEEVVLGVDVFRRA